MPANYVLLERIELNASAASVTFANIPQTGYTDLKIEISARTDRTGTVADNTIMQINSSTTSYSARVLEGNGAAASSFTDTNQPPKYTFNSAAVSATASTFSNVSIYIPNYAGSTNKSYSVDSVSETNATTAYARLSAGLLSNTAAITSLAFTNDGGANFVQYSTFSLYGLAAVGTTPAIAPKASGGNIIDYDGTYWIHTFLTSGTFTPQTGLSCDYLVVAGGGGGSDGAPGGAGGLRSTVTATGGGGSLESALSLAASTGYTVTIGSGGANGTATTNGTKGSDSVFSTITSNGGGAGKEFLSTATSNQNGGSGAGGINSANSGLYIDGGTATANQGRAGGRGFRTNGGYNAAGGGGGAGVAGTDGAGTGTAPLGGAGGSGVAVTISGSSITYAGGGGGGAEGGGGAAVGGTGGAGGGGAGSASTTGTSGSTNTGGGGGGGNTNVSSGGSGGSGIVIIRYLAA